MAWTRSGFNSPWVHLNNTVIFIVKIALFGKAWYFLRETPPGSHALKMQRGLPVFMSSYLSDEFLRDKPAESGMKDEPRIFSEEKMRDEEILRASQKEPAIFELLVEKYQAPLMRAAWRVVRNKEEAEDIVQEAFVKMYKKADKFEKLEGINFSSWAYKVTINTAITHYRKLKKGEVLAEDPGVYEKPYEGGAVEDHIAVTADARHVVAKVLEDMPPHLKTVLHSYYFGDKSYQTIAAEEEISIPTLKMRLFRAKKVLKKLLDGTPNNE